MTEEVSRSEPSAAQDVEISLIRESATNPRTHFDQAKLSELAESIVRFGVLQPVLLRPVTGKGGVRYELVAGHRRFRAARLIPLERIPAKILELTDKEVLEIQLVENLQREDLHPLEEADGYAALIRNHGYDADALGLKIGKSRSYVYGRMKLAELCADVKEALRTDIITHSVALLLARIPGAKLQKAALRGVLDHHGEAKSYRAAADYVQQEFMARLAEAPFDRDDAKLVAAAGPCSTCPMRTGNDPEFFGDVKSADVCTNPTCFAQKVDAHLKIEAKKNGWRALPAAEAEKVFPYSHSDVPSYGSGYVDLDARNGYDQGAKKWRQILPADVPVTLAKDRRGKVHQLVAEKDLPTKFQPRRSTSAASRVHDNTKWERARELQAIREKATAAAFERALAAKLPTVSGVWPFVAMAIVADHYHEMSDVLTRMGVRVGKKEVRYQMSADVALKYFAGLSQERQLAVVCDLLLGSGFDDRWGDDLDPKVDSLVRRPFFAMLGVDLAAEVELATTDLRAKWARADEKKKEAANQSRKKATKVKAAAAAEKKGKPGQAKKKTPPPRAKKAAKVKATKRAAKDLGVHVGELAVAAS